MAAIITHENNGVRWMTIDGAPAGGKAKLNISTWNPDSDPKGAVPRIATVEVDSNGDGIVDLELTFSDDGKVFAIRPNTPFGRLTGEFEQSALSQRVRDTVHDIVNDKGQADIGKLTFLKSILPDIEWEPGSSPNGQQCIMTPSLVLAGQPRSNVIPNLPWVPTDTIDPPKPLIIGPDLAAKIRG